MVNLSRENLMGALIHKHFLIKKRYLPNHVLYMYLPAINIFFPTIIFLLG